MKELSIEEKAKHYDEVREKIAIRFGSNVADEIFSQFEVSEDERIRKELIGMVKEDWPGRDDVLAWLDDQGEHANFRNKIQIGDKVTRNKDGVLVNLSQLNRVAKKDEKQGEQPKKHDVCDNCDQQGCCVSPCLVKLIEKHGEQKSLDDIVKEITKNKETAMSFLKSYGIMNANGELADEYKTEHGEQKPAELAKGGDYGIDGLYAAVDILQKTLGNVEGYQTDDGILEHECAISAVTELSKQKPVWSEEDEKMLDDIHEFFDKHKINPLKHDMDDYAKFIKSLKDRVLPQPKQEWSEEDKNVLDDIKVAVTSYWDADTENIILNWLKSLRPQSQWKPSEGQLECLGYAIEKAEKDWSPLTNNRIYLTLKALKEQLEKLREG